MLLQIEPSPDWKGGVAVAVLGELVEPRQWRREPEPWKAGSTKKLDGHGVPDTVGEWGALRKMG